jgi:hypothetical protein
MLRCQSIYTIVVGSFSFRDSCDSYVLRIWARDGACRGLVTVVELIDPRSISFQVTVYGNLILSVIYMSDRFFTQANTDLRLPLPSDLRKCKWG